MLFASIALQQNSSLFLLLNNLGFFSDNRLYSENFSEKAPVISDVGKSLIIIIFIHKFTSFFNSKLAGTVAIKYPVYEFASIHAKYNPKKTFLYVFDYRGSYSR